MKILAICAALLAIASGDPQANTGYFTVECEWDESSKLLYWITGESSASVSFSTQSDQTHGSGNANNYATATAESAVSAYAENRDYGSANATYSADVRYYIPDICTVWYGYYHKRRAYYDAGDNNDPDRTITVWWKREYAKWYPNGDLTWYGDNAVSSDTIDHGGVDIWTNWNATIEWSDPECPWTGYYWHHDTGSCGEYHGGLRVYSKTRKDSSTEGPPQGGCQSISHEKIFVYFDIPE